MEQAPKIRKTQLNLIVGINGTGKTTFIKEKVVPTRTKNLILTPDEAEWTWLPIVSTPAEIFNLQGSARMIYTGNSDLLTIQRNFYGGNLILDDAMAYLDQQTPATMQYIYIRRRQLGIDCYIVAHGLRQLPPKVFTFGSFLILFASTENFSVRKKDLQPKLFNRIIAEQERLNTLAEKGNPYNHTIIKLDPSI